jgi:hypothetical protein
MQSVIRASLPAGTYLCRGYTDYDGLGRYTHFIVPMFLHKFDRLSVPPKSVVK